MRDEAACLGWLNNIVADKKIDCIFPAYDDAQVWLKAREALLGGARVATSPAATTEACRSKSRTYELLAGKLRCPATYASAELVPASAFPVFIKPECGEGSKGCHKVASSAELATLLTPEHIICEYLPGDEYTVDCFTDAGGALQFAGARRRTLTRAGISIITESVEDASGGFRAMATAINEAMALIGAWFFQVKHAAGGELCLMEIAPRIPGAMALSRSLGVNFPLLTLYAHLGRPTTVLPPALRNVACCKIYANHYSFDAATSISALFVDLDDTLLMHEGHALFSGSGTRGATANPKVVALLYEACIVGLPTHLITRHRGDVSATLNAAHVNFGLFASVIHITDAHAPKSASIPARPAALLDDSFRERRDASAAGILTFDVDALDLLRDLVRASSATRPAAPSSSGCGAPA
jgi:hypothetical protein